MVVCVSIVVIGRYVFNSTPAWGEEIGLFCMVWFALLSAASGIFDNCHIRVTILSTLLSKRAAEILDLLVNLFLLTASFEQVVVCSTFVLLLCSFLTVLGVFVLRRKRPDLARPYRTWGYPFTPLLFLSVTAWMLCHILWTKPGETLVGLWIAALGLVLYLLSSKIEASSPAAPTIHESD
jgi:amino acid transporter